MRLDWNDGRAGKCGFNPGSEMNALPTLIAFEIVALEFIRFGSRERAGEIPLVGISVFVSAVIR